MLLCVEKEIVPASCGARNFPAAIHVRQVESVEGVNAPAITKAVNDHLPEGLLDTEADEKTGEEDERDD